MKDLRLLLVDDETDFRQTIAKRLTKRGFVPDQAKDGKECLSILEKKPVDLVVLDVKMPGMSGIEVLNRIQKKYPKTEVILLTGHATTSDGVEGMKLGAFDYLSKPIELEQLLGKIRQVKEKIEREEEKLKEIEFKAKMEQQMIATERLASLGTLAVGVAHEINNPLAIIKESAGWMKLILKKTDDAGMPRKKDFEMALSKIETGIERARRITHQLLGTVKKSDSVYSEVNLMELANETVQLVGSEAKNKDVEIVKKIDPDMGSIWSDPYRLRQVLINLLTNAVHATGSNGKITMSIEPDGENVSIAVSDTGHGIPRENMEKIFEPFFTTKSPGKGTGLGLFVIRGIIDKLGGEISVESQVGEGTSFCITLPKYQEIDGKID
ncbi:MAG: hybrid sensor histidine kinase/response regulator [Desulfobacteraceae bacterium 4484_190.3]|nr:MAG: hybrid sensor histidine kinase/response regulator [Desulfobacteraceae bacterium 4484_190.3]